MPGFRRGPDDLAQALTAFTRAIRCHRRLARLAPRFFDSTVVNRERQEREEQRRWMALWEPALAKAYGVDPDPLPAAAELPPLPSLRRQRVVDRELASWKFWMETGRLAWDRHHQRRPHALMSLTRLARLLQIAMDFGRLAVGRPALPETSFASRDANFMADLERAYGHPSQPFADAENAPASPDSPAEPVSPASSQFGSTPDPRPPQPATSPPAASQSSPPLSGPTPAAWPPPDDKQDLIPHALVIGPHGLLCLQRIERGKNPE